MILYNRKAVNQTVILNGKPVKFVACKAVVDDDFGSEVLKLGIPDLYEDGKQPVVETSKEIRMKSEFKDREDFYLMEIQKYKNMVESYKAQLKTAQADAAVWKTEYAKEHELRMQLLEAGKDSTEVQVPEASEMPAADPKPEENGGTTEEAPAEGEVNVEAEVEDLRKDLSSMKKDELIAFGQESGLDMESVKELTKKEIVEYILSAK